MNIQVLLKVVRESVEGGVPLLVPRIAAELVVSEHTCDTVGKNEPKT